MEATKPLYVMLSRTDTTMGKVIRLATRYEYNHVSLSLDPQFRNWVSFARYFQDVPLAGGFVTESPERYFSNGGSTEVRVFCVEIPQSKYLRLESLFTHAGSQCGLIYNTLGALASAMGLYIPVSGAYTCLEFANAVLGTSYRSIQQLDKALNASLIYKGKLSALVHDNGLRNGPYFTRRGLCGSSWDTARHFAKLFNRVIHPNSPDLINIALK